MVYTKAMHVGIFTSPLQRDAEVDRYHAPLVACAAAQHFPRAGWSSPAVFFIVRAARRLRKGSAANAASSSAGGPLNLELAQQARATRQGGHNFAAALTELSSKTARTADLAFRRIVPAPPN